MLKKPAAFKNNLLWLLVLITSITAIKLLYIYISPHGAFFDEAQYWSWSKDFDFGYYSKPPIIAWMIMGTTEFCGDGLFCVRLSAVICHFFASIFIFLTARKLYDSNIAIWSSILYLTLPGITASSYFISADAPLMLFWAMSLYFFVKAVKDKKLIYWLLLGLAAGLGMMSKYTMAAFFISAAIYFINYKKPISSLLNPKLILSGLIALLVFTPNLYWNYSNNFISFLHTNENVFSNGQSIYPLKMLEFIGAQFLLFGPILFNILLITFKRCDKILASFTYTLLLIALTLSLVSGAQGHWAAPIYIAGVILVVNFCIKSQRKNLLVYSLIFNIIIGAAFYNFTSIASYMELKRDPFARLKMWSELDSPTRNILANYPDALLLSDERKSTASLIYSLRSSSGEPYPVIKWNSTKRIRDHYDLNANINNHVGKDFIFVTRASNIDNIARYFKSAKIIESHDLYGTKFRFYYLENFSGL